MLEGLTIVPYKKSKSEKGNKNRKIGRQGRRACHARYKTEQRWNKNKARRIAKYMLRFEKWYPTNLDKEVSAIIRSRYPALKDRKGL